MTGKETKFTSYMGDTPPQFANRSEEECAKILDYYRIPWMYEPRTFVLERDEQGKVVEAFTPDFYLPEQDMFVELTTMKQAHVTKKNMKIRKVRERFPEINIKLFYKKDFIKLAHKYDLSQE
ncbi:MAG: PDDEXK family nuclease [Thermoleophilia bacterium]